MENIKRNLADFCEESSKIFGANKNLYRIIPSLTDGLKPVSRRFLYSLYMTQGITKWRKMNKLAADTMSDYHPHGQDSINDVAAKSAQPWSNHVMLIESRGNFGSVRGDEAGAGRYIEGKMSRFAHWCFFQNFSDYNVDMKLTYTGDGLEPEYLPARVPYILFNPQLSGIGYGLSSNIPPFNVTEVCQATIKLAKNPKAKIMLIPDSPTGCDVVDIGTFKEMNDHWKSKFMLRATYEIDHIKNVISITSLPLQTNVKMVNSRIVKYKNEGKLDDLKDIKDYTKNLEVRYQLYLKNDADPEAFMQKLFKLKTGLKETYPVGLRVIDDYQDYAYGLREMILTWLDARRELVRGCYNKRLVLKMEEEHLNEVFILVLSGENAKKTLKICRESKNKDHNILKLVSEYGITSLQAKAVLSMAFSMFNEDSVKELIAKREELRNAVIEIERILDDEEAINNIIIEEQEECIKLFGRPRKSSIVSEVDAVDDYPSTEHLVGISMDGYIKKLPHDATTIGHVGKLNSNTYIALKISNRDNLLVFDSFGNVCKVPIYSIPETAGNDIGVSLNKYFKLSGNVIIAINEPTKEFIEQKPNTSLVFITKRGLGKRVTINEFENIKGVRPCISLEQHDELVNVIVCGDATQNDIIIYTNQASGTRIDIMDLPTSGKAAKGSRTISLKSGEYVEGAFKMDVSNNMLLYITSSGKMKLTEIKYFPVMTKNDNSLSLLKLDDSDTLVGIVSVKQDDSVIIYKKNSEKETVNLREVPVLSRASKAEKMVRCGRGDMVIGYKVIPKK